MTSNYAPAHHQTTTFGDENEYNKSHSSTSATNDTQTSRTVQQDDLISPAVVNTETQSVPGDRLASVHEPRTSLSETEGPLASTEGPFHQPTTDEVAKNDAPLTSSVSSQNAPGRAGSIGEAAMSAFGYGGTHVERPKEEQGLGEKIVNFLGA